MEQPRNVREAVRPGVDYVLQNQQSYMRTAKAPAPPPAEVTAADVTAADVTAARMLAHYTSQPPLDYVHQLAGANIPVVF